MHIPRAQDHQSKNKNIFKEFSMNQKYGAFVQTLLKIIRPQHQVLKPKMDLSGALVARLAPQMS